MKRWAILKNNKIDTDYIRRKIEDIKLDKDEKWVRITITVDK